MARITHPRPQLGRSRPGVAGVVFVDGVAEVDLSDKPVLHEFYLRQGYGVEHDVDELGGNVNVPLSTLTIAELRKVAADNDFEIPSALKLKADIAAYVETMLAVRTLHPTVVIDGPLVVEGSLTVTSAAQHAADGV